MGDYFRIEKRIKKQIDHPLKEDYNVVFFTMFTKSINPKVYFEKQNVH